MRTSVYLAVMALALSVGCSKETPQNIVGPQIAEEAESCSPYDYGGGVLHFPCRGPEFARSLSAYMRQHRLQQVTGMAGDSNGSQGSDKGYFVTIGPRC